jgi:hypothetical protein
MVTAFSPLAAMKCARWSLDQMARQAPSLQGGRDSPPPRACRLAFTAPAGTMNADELKFKVKEFSR